MRDRNLASGRDSDLVSLCLALSLLGRRALGAAGHNALSTMEFFLVGLYSLFKVKFCLLLLQKHFDLVKFVMCSHRSV